MKKIITLILISFLFGLSLNITPVQATTKTTKTKTPISKTATKKKKIVKKTTTKKSAKVTKKKIIKKTTTKKSAKVTWSSDALAQLRKIPSGIRPSVKAKYTNYAVKHGIKTITKKVYNSIHI